MKIYGLLNIGVTLKPENPYQGIKILNFMVA